MKVLQSRMARELRRARIKNIEAYEKARGERRPPTRVVALLLENRIPYAMIISLLIAMAQSVESVPSAKAVRLGKKWWWEAIAEIEEMIRELEERRI